ncbi:hypothetical protein [Zhongshania sp.]|uniref:hypothetical protein n=1 Tax=Zhongshania sp. TaxID=1971902 RepID=UPI0035622A8A
MARGILQGFAQDLAGNALAGAEISIYLSDGNYSTKVPYYSSLTGGSTLNQDTTPILSASDGLFQAAFDEGDYDVEWIAGAVTKRLRAVPVFSVTQALLEAITANAAKGLTPIYSPRATGDGSNKVFSTGVTGVQTPSAFAVYVAGVRYRVNIDFTYDDVTGNITFITAPGNGVEVDILYYQPLTVSNAPFFDDTADGLANTVNGEYFNTPGQLSDEHSILYKNVNGTAQEISRLLNALDIRNYVDVAEAARDAAQTSEANAATSETNAASSEALAEQHKTDAQAAAQASGAIKFYDTKAAADADVGNLLEGDVVEVFVDETQGERNTRYRLESGVLVFKVFVDSARGASVTSVYDVVAGATDVTVLGYTPGREEQDYFLDNVPLFVERGEVIELNGTTVRLAIAPTADSKLIVRQKTVSSVSTVDSANATHEGNSLRDEVNARVPSYLVSEVAALTGPIGKNIIIADRDHSIWEAVAPGAPDGYSRLAGNGVDWVLAETGRVTPEMFGAVGDGVATAGIFSGTDDTGPIQAWLDWSRDYYAYPDKVYMCGNLTLPDYSGSAAYLHTDINIAFSGAADTSYGLTDYHHANNQTTVMRGLRGPGRWRLYGNDHVTNAYIGCMFGADARFVVSRCLGAGFVLTTLRANGTTKIAGTAVDNRIEIELHDNDGIGFQVIDSDQNKITDGHLHIPVSEGNGGYDFQIEPGAGWQVQVDRNYGSAGGGRILLGSAATHVHFGQCDSGSASPSGATGWGFYCDNVLTSETFDQATGFVKVSGQMNYGVSVGGLSGGSGRRGLDLNGLTFATANGHALLPNTSNAAITMLVRGCTLSYRGWATAFGTANCALRHAAAASLARFIVSNTMVKLSANEYYIGETTVQDGGGAPKVTPVAGVITITGAGHWRVEAETGTADDIDTINGLAPGAIATFSIASGGDTITFKDGTGNLRLAGDFALNDGSDTITLRQFQEGANLIEISRSDNA